MAYASTSPISYLGTLASGVMEDNAGFAVATKEITALNRAAANSHIQLAASSRQATNQPNSGAIDTLGNRDILGSGAFTGTVPGVYTSTLGSGFAMDALNAHGNLMFGTGPIQMAQTFFIAEGFTQTSLRLAPTLDKLNEGVEFGKFPATDLKEYPANGLFPNYLGSAYTDYQGVVTNGISSLVTSSTEDNFALLAQDLNTLGTAFSVSDIANFGNPGQVVSALYNVDGLGVTGIDVMLASLRINPETVYNLGAENLNTIMQGILDRVTLPELIQNAQSLLGSSIQNMESLGDFTNFERVFVQSKDIISFSTFAELKQKLQAIELGRVETVAQLAAYIDSIVPVTLPTIANRRNFVNRGYLDSVIAKFLGGTGPYNSITMSDMIGILGGVGVAEPSTNYRAAMKRLSDAGELSNIRARIQELTAGLNGVYTSVVDVGPPIIIEINDPNGITHSDYESFQAAKIGQIESAIQVLMNKRNVNPDIQIAINSWLAISKKIIDEKDFQSRIDMNYDIRTNFSDNAISFVTGLRGTINERSKGPVIRGMVNQAILDGDIGGEYMLAYIQELDNKNASDDYDIRWRAQLDD